MILLHPPLRPTICLLCLHPPLLPLKTPLLPSRSFTTTPPYHADAPNHYETLSLPPTATAAEIKSQFYALSKRYHPDLNPTDPTASWRFVKISEAYHVLGSPTKRALYDRERARAHKQQEPGAARGGSYSSASGPVGSRPASGLSRRRTVFRGPPPSFYAQGGYGGARRGTGERGERGEKGFAPGYRAPEYEDDGDGETPHWNRAGHFKTHEGLGSRREDATTRRRRRADRWADVEADEARGSLLLNFIVVGGVVGMIAAVPTWWIAREEGKKAAAAAIKVQKRENG